MVPPVSLTMEDCIETLLGVEIMDESDEVADMRELAKDQCYDKNANRKKMGSNLKRTLNPSL